MARTIHLWSPQSPLAMRFLDALGERTPLRPNTRAAYESDLRRLLAFLASRGVQADRATAEDLRCFREGLIASGRSAMSTVRVLGTARRFYRFLHVAGVMAVDPAERLEIPPRATRGMGCRVLSESARRALLEAPDVDTPLGFRDRVMLELCFGLAITVSELVGLRLDDVDLERRVMRVDTRGRMRTVELPVRAQQWLRRWIDGPRAELGLASRHDWVFPSRGGVRPLSRQLLWFRVKAYARELGLPDVTPRTLRDTRASVWLQKHDDLAAVQRLLGHRSHGSTRRFERAQRSAILLEVESPPGSPPPVAARRRRRDAPARRPAAGGD